VEEDSLVITDCYLLKIMKYITVYKHRHEYRNSEKN